ncbi:MAG: hypothetical protein HY726_13585 [Candidatus Rokubacteria bacterium]|nr:hypothetical protein [Candidatus Rokubacteria bacterium]
MRKWLISACTLALLAWPLTPLAQAALEKPSISARFETPRDFGYHIGDLISLTLLIEAETSVVIDLENLPHGGDTVGAFEVRDVRIGHSRTASGSAYRIEFTLQTFVPAMSAVGVVFPPIELRFALPGDRSADGGYVYRTVTLPPHVFFLSPTAVGRRVLRANKGSVLPPTAWFFWGAVSLGGVLLTPALLMLAWNAARWWKRRSREELSPAGRRALGRLRVLRGRYLACEEKTPDMFLKVGAVLRRFLREECGIPARAQTIHQIRERFRGHPLEKELTAILERYSEVIYDGHHPAPAEKENIIREVAALIDRLERVGCPTHGGNGASR